MRTELLARLVFAQEDERRRIAREMHDQFGEQLTALEHAIQPAHGAVQVLAHRAAAGRCARTVAQTLDRDVEHLVWELRPTALDDLGLRAALTNYVQDWSKRVGIPAELHASGLLDDRLPSETETTLYRIAQEALTNVAKHSRAGHVEVILERRADHVLLVVEDDGVGFEPGGAAERRRASGCSGMQERAALVGATLEIESAAGHGTTILVRMAHSVAVDAGRPSMPERAGPPADPPGRRSRHGPARAQAADRQPARYEGRGRGERRQRARSCGRSEVKPHVVVMDISMPGINGLVATRRLKRAVPACAAIVTLTRHSDDAYLQELLRAGVSGYVLKQSAPSELLQAIRAAAAGRQYLDSALTARVTAGFLAREGKRPRGSGGRLTEREAEVLRLIATGYSNKEIASRLSLSVKTIEAHKANAMRKLGLTGRIDIVKYAVLQGWLENA